MKKKIIVLISLLLILCLNSVAAVYATEGSLYEDLLVERLGIVDTSWGEPVYWYDELFYYYADNTGCTPDYVLINASYPLAPDDFTLSYFGEYVILTGCFSPYKHGYHIYTPADDRIYTLEEAYYANVGGIEEALRFLGGTAVAIHGDADANFELNIKDATWIQKFLVNYYDLYEAHNWDMLAVEACDFNRDNDVNIKDATAIQKHVAGLPY